MSFLTSSKLNSMKKSFRNGDYAKALAYAEKLTPADIHTSYDLSMLADVYMENGRVEEARNVYSELYGRNKSSRLCKQLIDLSIELDDIEQAIEYLSELTGLDPEDYERYVFQFRIGKIIGESDEYLLNNLQKVREADYIDKWAFELAKLYFKLGRKKDCIKECKNIILWFPETGYAHRAQLMISACESGLAYDELVPVVYKEFKMEGPDDSDENGNIIMNEPEDVAEVMPDDAAEEGDVPEEADTDGETEEIKETDAAEEAEETEEVEEETDEATEILMDEDEYYGRTEEADPAAEETDETDEEELNDEDAAELLDEELEEEETAEELEEPVEDVDALLEAADAGIPEEDEEDLDKKLNAAAEELSASDKTLTAADSAEIRAALEEAAADVSDDMPVYDPFADDELPTIVFPEESEENNKSELSVDDKIKNEEKAHVPSQNTIIRDALADEVMQALRLQEEKGGKEADDAVDESIRKLLEENT